MNVVLQVLYTVLGLGFLIFIHELGHFVAAKIFKVQTNEFSLGIGPKLISVKKIKATGKKKGSQGCPLAVAGVHHFLMPTFANLLRNFSTRPPRLSTLFCVPV